MLNRIIEAKALPGYRLFVRFEDGAAGEVSLAHLVGKGVFEAWEDVSEFESVMVDPESGTVVWPSGADLAPDALHRQVSSFPIAG